MMKTFLLNIAILITWMSCVDVQASATPYDRNLIANGSGEKGVAQIGSDNDSPYFKLTGWLAEQGDWAAQGGAWHRVGAPDGERFIRPMPSELAVLSQTTPLSFPQGKTPYVILSGMIRNWDTTTDLPSMELQLLDAKKQVIATKTIGPVRNAQWKECGGFIKATAETKFAKVKLISKRVAGEHNDSYFDHIQLKLSEKQPLFVDFEIKRVAGSLPPSYRFTDNTPGQIKTRKWTFSDGQIMDGNTVTRSFEEAGEFGVKLDVTNLAGEAKSFDRPQSIHIAKGDLTLRMIKGPYLQMSTTGGMTIMWETNATADSEVVLGTGSQQRRVKSDKPATIHEVRVEGFKPSEKVSYQVESKVKGFQVKSEQSTFTTAPTAGTDWRLAVWGDSQDRPEVFTKIVAAMDKADPNLLLCVGDLVSTGTVYAQWENRLFTPIKPLAKRVPFIAAKGNHEYDSTWWYQFMSLPNNERWYTYNYANARFIVLDTNYPFAPETPQHKWLVKELRSEASKNATWLIVVHHHPPFSELYDEELYKKIREQLWPLYENAGVDLNFHGHIHDYEYGHYIPKHTGRRIVTVQTSGGGGTLWKDEFNGDWPQIDKVIQWKHHWCRLDFKGDKIDFQAIDLDGEVIHQWQLKAQSR